MLSLPDTLNSLSGSTLNLQNNPHNISSKRKSPYSEIAGVAKELLIHAHETGQEIFLSVSKNTLSNDSENNLYLHPSFEKKYELFAGPNSRTVQVYVNPRKNQLTQNDFLGNGRTQICLAAKSLQIYIGEDSTTLSRAKNVVRKKLRDDLPEYFIPAAIRRIANGFKLEKVLQNVLNIVHTTDYWIYNKVSKQKLKQKVTSYMPRYHNTLLHFTKELLSVQTDPLEVQKALKPYMRAFLKSLEAVHAGNVTHMNIKPETLLLYKDSLAISNFKMGCEADANGEEITGGTVDYFPPEKLSVLINYNLRTDPTDHAIDVWAAGCTFYNLLNCMKPFNWTMLSLLMHQLFNVREEICVGLRNTLPATDAQSDSANKEFEADFAAYMPLYETIIQKLSECKTGILSLDASWIGKLAPSQDEDELDKRQMDIIDEIDSLLDFYLDESRFIISNLKNKLAKYAAGTQACIYYTNLLLALSGAIEQLQETMLEKINEGVISLENAPATDDELLELVRKMVRLDPAKRITAKEASIELDRIKI